MIRCYITLIIVACIIGCYGRLRFSVPNFKDPLQNKITRNSDRWLGYFSFRNVRDTGTPISK